MDLFQSGRDPWQDPYPYIWQRYARMSSWFQDMPQNTLPAIKSFFELELLYSYVYLLSPSPRVPHIHEYAQRLIFEHCIAYATNLLTVLNKPSNSTKPPVTFYDAMRAYMTGRQFVDVLSRNMDVILDTRPATPPAPSNSQADPEDPLAPAVSANPPPFPSPLLREGQVSPADPTTRAIDAIHDFTTALSNFGLRFGFTHWRDRFQRESAALSAQLYQRSAASAHTSPVSQQIPSPATFPPQWIPMPSVSPQAQQLMYANPTTPPSLFPQQPSPFSSSMSYNGNPYEQSTSPHQPSVSYDHQQQHQHAQIWNSTPSPQAMPDMPQPTEGRKRQALVYGAGLPAQHSPQSQSPSSAPPQMPDSGTWVPHHSAHPSQTDNTTWSQPQLIQPQDSTSWTQVPASQPENNWTQGSSQGTWT